MDLVRNARLAEEVGLGFALISDHYHPRIDEQCHSPFMWSVIGAIAQATQRLELGTGVTAPTMRMHPAIMALAAGTSACLLPACFFLGVGTGENLNEHTSSAIVGRRRSCASRCWRGPSSSCAWPVQVELLRFCAREILPELAPVGSSR